MIDLLVGWILLVHVGKERLLEVVNCQLCVFAGAQDLVAQDA